MFNKFTPIHIFNHLNYLIMKEQEKKQLSETWETPEIMVINVNEETKLDLAGNNDGGLFS